jgi:hypothetical protein
MYLVIAFIVILLIIALVFVFLFIFGEKETRCTSRCYDDYHSLNHGIVGYGEIFGFCDFCTEKRKKSS